MNKKHLSLFLALILLTIVIFSVFHPASRVVMASNQSGAPSVNITPMAFTMDVGQYTTFTATASGGSGSYTEYFWYVNGKLAETQTQSGAQSTMPFNGAYVTAGTYSITVEVTDSSNANSSLSFPATVTVNSALVAPTASTITTSISQGQSSTLSITGLSGGTPPYIYQWLSEPPGLSSLSDISGATSNTYAFSTSGVTSTGSWVFLVQVTDSAGGIVDSNSIVVNVNSASPTPTPTTVATPTPPTTPTPTPVVTPTPTPVGTPSPTPIPTAPLLMASLSQSQLTIQQGTGTATSTLNIQNAGGGILSWSIESSPSWISFSQTQGNINSGIMSPITIQINTASLTTGTQQGSIFIQSNGGQKTLTLSVTLTTESNSGDGWGPSGEPITTTAAMSYNSTNKLYNFEFTLAPAGNEYVFLDQNEQNTLFDQIFSSLKQNGFSINTNTKAGAYVTPTDVIDDQAINALDFIIEFPSEYSQYVDNFYELGAKLGFEISAAQWVEIYELDQINPSPPEIVAHIADSVFTTVNEYEAKLANEIPSYVFNGKAAQPYAPVQIAGLGQQILITIANLTGPSSLPSTLDINLQNIKNAIYVPPNQQGTLLGAFQPAIPGINQGGFLFSTGLFNAPLTLNKPAWYAFWDQHTYEIGPTTIQDPMSPFISITADNVLVSNLLFNSSIYTLSADASLVDSSRTGNLTIIVPLLIDQLGSSSFSFTLNAVPIPSASYLTGYGYVITLNINGNGKLIMTIPTNPPQLVASANAGTLIVFGNGFPSDVSLSLQYFNGSSWLYLSDGSVATSDTGDFYFNTTAVLPISSSYVTFLAKDSLGDVAFTAVATNTLPNSSNLTGQQPKATFPLVETVLVIGVVVAVVTVVAGLLTVRNMNCRRRAMPALAFSLDPKGTRHESLSLIFVIANNSRQGLKIIERKILDKNRTHGISTLIIVAIVIIAIAVVGIGIYSATRGSGAARPSASAPNNGLAHANSVEFNVTLNVSNGTLGRTNSQSVIYEKNIGKSNVEILEETTNTAPSSGFNEVIINGVPQKLWSYSSGHWTDQSADTTLFNIINSTVANNINILASSWTGSGGYTYNILNGGGTLIFSNIIVNPSLPDSMFQPPS